MSEEDRRVDLPGQAGEILQGLGAVAARDLLAEFLRQPVLLGTSLAASAQVSVSISSGGCLAPEARCGEGRGR
jgi:hypothetical protein